MYQMETMYLVLLQDSPFMGSTQIVLLWTFQQVGINAKLNK